MPDSDAQAVHSDTWMVMMKRSTLLVWPVLACLLAGGCDGAGPAPTEPFDLEATRQIIAQENQRFTDAHLSGDVATIDAMLAPDAKAYPPGAPAVSGLQALHDFTVEYIGAGLTEFREETTDSYGNAEYVVDAGTYVVTYGTDNVTERGKYLSVWQQVNGTWKIKSNMWNTGIAAPTPN